MTIDIFDGSAVEVEMPVRVPEVQPASVPTPQGIAVPVQGSLTAEQLAHIVSVVTAKVIAELGGQQPGGGGGAGIDDTTVGTDTTWSSQNIDGKLAGKASFNASIVIDAETGEREELGSLNDLVISLATNLSMAAIWVDAENYHPVNGATFIVSELPAEPGENTMYVVRQPDGTCTFHLPILRDPIQGPGGAP